MPTETAVTNRELLVALKALEREVAKNTSDTREARDGMIRIEATLKEQDIGEQLMLLRKDGADVVDRIEARLLDHDKRINALEKEHSRASGALGLGGWLSGRLPWLVGAGGIVAAFVGWIRSGHH